MEEQSQRTRKGSKTSLWGEPSVESPWARVKTSHQQQASGLRPRLGLSAQHLPLWLESRAPSDMLPISVYLLRLFPGLVSFQKDLAQGQKDGHSHRQEEGDVDGKLLVIGEIQEVEE